MPAVERAQPIRPIRMGQAEHERNYWVITTEPEITKDDLLNPEYWANVSNRLKPWDRIEVRSDDGAIFAELVVISSGRVWARVECLQFYDFAKKVKLSEVKEDDRYDEFEVKYAGPKIKFRIIRKKDQEMIKEGIQSKDEANAFLKQYLSTIYK